ncbi:MAG: glycosyltransferase family 4 protein [Hyphomicrobiaceae bacterium]|nr:glycosyltransferase family 4 protein [Hyphomicrobiaceae bacterium]
MTQQQLVLIHPIDPRGEKVGGIETHVRLLMQRHPDDVSVLLIGVDGRGDLTPGEVVKIKVGEREIEFLPVMAFLDDTAKHAASKLTQSLTFRFTLALLRSFRQIYKLAHRMPSSADLQRFEFAPFAKALRIPTVQVVHGEGRKDQKMDSLIKKFWYIQEANEKIAMKLANHILCVNPNIKKRIEEKFPRQSDKSEVMTVSVDTKVFSPSPFDVKDDVLKLVFTGRLDSFKDPALMFKTIKALGEKLDGKVELHYVGTSDPHRYEDFAQIEHLTIRHGFQNAAGVAKILSQVHAGIITSFFEGMPCFMLEVLSSGRPMGTIKLPQYELIVKPGTSGFFVERADTMEQSAEQLSDAFVELWSDIKAGKIEPRAVHECISPFTVDNQLPRVFKIHRQLVAAA